VRLQAAHLFEQDASPVQAARRLRVSTKSAYQWRRCWRAGGEVALASKGAGGAVCRLSAGQLARLRAALDGGPAAWGWDQDQRWTLVRVTTLIGRLFHVRVRKGERRSMSEADYAGLVTAAHNQLHAPVILVWDNLNARHEAPS
jgi:transposase